MEKKIMDEIKNLRMTVGMKQYKLAIQLGIDQSNYANIENNKLIPNNIEAIKQKAINILLPMLESKIQIVEKELNYLKNLKLNVSKDQTPISK